MKNLTIAFMAVAALTSVGCKKKGGGAGEAMAKMAEFKDKMCACKDKKCADDVQDQMNKWSAENAKNAGDKAEKPDEKTMKEMQDVGTKYGECMAKAMTGGETPPPPPAGSDSGSGSAAAAGSGSAAAPAGDAPKVGEGPVVSAMTLAKHDLPPFKGAPASALWTSAEAEKEGLKLTNLMDGDKMFLSVRFYDCNLPKMKEISTEDRASYQYCFVAPAADAPKIKAYPRMDKPAAEVGAAIKVGHVIVEVSVPETQRGKVKDEDVVAWLETADFSTIEK